MTYNPQDNRFGATPVRTGYAVDAGLQSYMQDVYKIMGMGLGVTGLTAFAVSSVEPLMQLIFGTPLAYVVMLAPLAFIFFGFTPARMQRWEVSKIRGMFYLFSALMGLSLASIFIAFTGTSIVRVFFITAATFAAAGIYGYTAKKDLTSMGSFLFMGLIGIVIASVVNLFLASSALQFAVSVIGVLIFTGLTAFETQRLKEVYVEGNATANQKMAVMGALSLYLNFINLFQSLLHLMGNRN